MTCGSSECQAAREYSLIRPVPRQNSHAAADLAFHALGHSAVFADQTAGNRPWCRTATCSPVSAPEATISSAAAWMASCMSATPARSATPELPAEGIELLAGAVLPPARLLPAAAERALPGDHEPGATIGGPQLHGGDKAVQPQLPPCSGRPAWGWPRWPPGPVPAVFPRGLLRVRLDGAGPHPAASCSPCLLLPPPRGASGGSLTACPGLPG